MKVFIDIGAYNGDTLDLALKYGYNEIHCVEPSTKHHAALDRKAERAYPHIHIHKHGLSNKYEKIMLWGTGSDGASMYSKKRQTVQGVESMKVFPAGDWFQIWAREEDTVHVKINVEGAEIPILNDLIRTHEIHKVNELCVFYDCVKVPGHEMFLPMMERKLNKFPHLDNRLGIERQRVVYGDPQLAMNRQFVRNWMRKLNTP